MHLFALFFTFSFLFQWYIFACCIGCCGYFYARHFSAYHLLIIILVRQKNKKMEKKKCNKNEKDERKKERKRLCCLASWWNWENSYSWTGCKLYKLRTKLGDIFTFIIYWMFSYSLYKFPSKSFFFVFFFFFFIFL